MTALVPCSACHRHIRVDHTACPFCAADVPEDFARRAVPGSRGRRLDRFAFFTFAAALGVTGCLAETSATPSGPSADAGEVDAARDGGGSDAAKDAATTDGRVDDDGGAVAMYGLPYPGDASTDAASDAAADADSGGVQALYGLPPNFDAG